MYASYLTNHEALAPLGDIAFMVARGQFQEKAMHLLKLARSALIYLAIGVGFEERRRAPSLVGNSIEELPSAHFLDNAEKIFAALVSNDIEFPPRR